MAYVSLSRKDLQVLGKIRNPDSDPTQGVVIDSSMPQDPHVREADLYARVSKADKEFVSSLQNLELELAGVRRNKAQDVSEAYRRCIESLDKLVSEFPAYASARNNRAQALRRLYGDNTLLDGCSPSHVAMLQDIDGTERMHAAQKMLSDLDQSIYLLTPPTPRTPISPQAAKTLSMAHTQRAAIYHATAKSWASGKLSINVARREASWSKLDFEENASRDFALGGRYGNDVARSLAVSANPTAKLCGQIVREAMRKEYGAQLSA